MKSEGIIRVLTLSVLLIVIAFNAYAFDYPHFEINNIGCDSCHFIYGTEPTLLPPWTAHTPQNIDDTQHNTLCWSCHNDVDAPYVRTHSSLQIDNSYGNWTVECRVCHNPHYQKQKEYGSSSYLYSGASTAVTATTITKTGAGWTADAYNGMIVIPNISQNKYVYQITDHTEDTLTIEGPMDLTKVTTGNTIAIMYGNLINKTIDLSKITITPAKSGSKTTRFFRPTSSKSFADGDATYDGVCEVCHTQTTHFRNGAYGSDPTYTNPLHTNVGAPAGTNCTTCHSHENGFRHGGGGGTGCGDAISCHGTRESHPTHVGGSGMQLSLACSECHNTSSFPLFKDGQNLANTTACNPCHSPGGTYDGVNNANYGVKNNWSTGVYSGNALQAGKEKWCASCHDESPSVIQTINAPNVIGDEDDLYTYGTGWGFYKTGHGLPSSQKYPASGGVTAGAGKECLDCHDKSLAHVDGNARTFDCGNGCDSTEYRTSYRLKLIGGQEPMRIPLALASSLHDSTLFRLCYSCHDTGPFTDSVNVNTNFRSDDSGNPNAHYIHIALTSQLRYPADYNYSSANNSSPTCVICHNVHGSTRLAMVNDGRLIGREPGLKIWYRNDSVVNYNINSPNPPNPENLPLASSTGHLLQLGSSSNLCSNCHGNNNVTPISRTPYQNIAVMPTLSWTGQSGYVSDGVNPDSGAGASGFTFKVQYTDGNNDAPAVYQVWIDMNDNGTYEANEKFDMSATNPGDTNYYDGNNYTYTKTLSKTGDNIINYRFKFSNAGGDATGAPASDSQFTVTNSAPTLLWTGEIHYAGEGVHPNPSGSGTNFIFRIKYKDTDNEPPSSMQVWVDTDDSGTYEPGEKYDMTAVDGGDTNYADGKLYTKTLALSYAGDGSFNYRFFAADGIDNATGSPTSNSTVVVTSASNNAPSLSWTGETDYTADGVEPNTGAANGTFTFRVKYTDTDNNAPTSIQVWIDEDDNGAYAQGEKYNMAEVSGGQNDYTDGKIFIYSKTLAYQGDGTLKYLFYASDGLSSATGDPTNDGSNTLTMVNTCAVVCPSLTGDCTYTSIATAVNACATGSYILVKDGTYNERVVFTNKAINVRSLNGAAVTIIDGGAGGSTVKFDNASSTLDGFTIQNGSGTGNNGGGVYIYNNSAPVIKNCIIKNNTVSLDGGGVWIYGGSSGAAILNTTITGNTGRNGGGIGFSTSSGVLTISNSTIKSNNNTNGALYLKTISTLTTITGTTISNNTTTTYGGGIFADEVAISLNNSHVDGNTTTGSLGDGGGIYLYGVAGGPYNSTITNSTINGNTGYRNGGGIRVFSNGAALSATITNSSIDNNIISGTAGNGGGIHVQGANAALTVSGSSISNNRTDDNDPPAEGYHGGGVYLLSTGQAISISNCVINNNKTYENGGGIFAQDATAGLTISNSTLNGNTQASSTRNGGAIYTLRTPLSITKSVLSGNTANGNGGGIYSNDSEPLTITNSIITGNKAVVYYGGGVYLVNSDNTQIVNTTFGANQSEDGGAIYFNSGTAVVKNSILWGDYATSNREIRTSGTLTVTYSDVQGGFDGTGNQYVDPLFVEERSYGEAPTSAGNYHLQSGPPVINQGTNDEGDGVSVPSSDIDGQTRPKTGSDPADMGADEYNSSDTTAPEVISFFATSPSTSIHIPVTSFTATDNVGVTGYRITSSATPPSSAGGGWSATAPTIYSVNADGTYTLYPWVKDASGNVSAVFDTPRTVVVDTAEPSVDSTTPANAATDVALNSAVTNNWDESVDCTTVTTSTVTISPSGGWTRTSCSGSQAVFTPSGQSGSTVYTITVSTSVKDTNGNAMASSYQFSYTTVPPTVAAPTIGTPAALSTTSIRWNFTDNASNEEGFKVHDSSHTVKASSATQNLTYLDETGLTANTQYIRHVHAYKTGEDSLGSANASAYALPATPNVTADKTVSTWYSTTDVVFTNAAGFGSGGVQYYRYVWDKNATYSFNDTETQWSSGTLTKTSTSTGSW